TMLDATGSPSPPGARSSVIARTPAKAPRPTATLAAATTTTSPRRRRGAPPRRAPSSTPPRPWPSRGTATLALDRARGETTDDVALEREERDEDGQRRDDGSRREEAPVGRLLLRDPLVHAHDERPVVLGGEDDAREDEVAEHPDEREQADDGERRGHERHDDAPEDLPVARPVDERGLVDLARHRIEEPEHEEGVRPERAPEVDADERELGVDAERRHD